MKHIEPFTFLGRVLAGPMQFILYLRSTSPSRPNACMPPARGLPECQASARGLSPRPVE